MIGDEFKKYKKTEDKIKEEMNDSEKNNEDIEQILKSANKAIKSVESGLEDILDAHPEILDKMSKEEKKKLNSLLKRVKKRMEEPND